MQQKELCATCGEPTLDGNTAGTTSERRHLDGTSLCPPRRTVRAVRPAAEAGAICAEATRDYHDLDCPFTEGSRPHETPVIAAAPTVLDGHIHRPGCPQVVRRPGHLFVMVAEAHVMCLMCGRLDTIDADAFDSFGGTTEGYERCTACGESWGWCDISAIL